MHSLKSTFVLIHSKVRDYAAIVMSLAAATVLVISPATQAEELRVVELFTSQGCYSCPAADDLLGEIMSENDNVLGLEFHVDYWNDLVHGSAGSWQDPFSSKAYSTRQRLYRQIPLQGNEGVYTPQAIVNGRYAMVGSNRRQLNKAIATPDQFVFDVTVAAAGDNSLNVAVAGQHMRAANIMLVNYLKKTSTNITSGENKSLVMHNFNVVTGVENLGTVVQRDGKQFEVSYAKADNLGCAVLVQTDPLGPILGAAVCP